MESTDVECRTRCTLSGPSCIVIAMKALIFDLDGTLIDSVYAHTLAWQRTLSDFGLDAPAYSIHRRIGMSGQLLVKAVAREHGRRVRKADIKRLENKHATLMQKISPVSKPLPGAKELLAYLHKARIAHGIATSGKRSGLTKSVRALALSSSAMVIDGDMVEEVKPEPELFLLCQQKLQVEPAQCLVIGDAIWDVHAARRAGILSIGLLTGGYGAQELYNAGAMRVFRDAAELLSEIDELGIQGSK
jgi:HAD superfamily hydrolase (TIGR01509 family)